MKLCVKVAIITSLISYSLQAQSKKIDTNFLIRRVPEMMDSAGVPGLSVGIVQKGKLVWSKGFGVANTRTKKPITEATVFEAASLSKPMFGYICLKLIDQKVLDLDKPLTDYVSKDSIQRFFLRHKIIDNRFYKITARMCLSHSSGLPNGRGGYVPINFEPSTDMHYSGEGISYLQFVVEHLTKKNLENLAKEYVFEPFGMSQSSYIWTSERYQDITSDSHGSNGYAVGFVRKSTLPQAAYTLITNAEDYGKFLAAILSKKGFDDKIFEEMWTAQSKAKTSFLVPMTWGLGVGLYQTDLGTAFWHWGDMGTTKAYMVGIPDEKSGLVIFTNSANGLTLVHSLLDMTIGGGKHQFFQVLGVRSYDEAQQKMLQSAFKDGLPQIVADFNQYKRKHDKLKEENILETVQKLISFRKYQDALQIAKMGVLEYPQSHITHNALGDAFLKLNKTKNAVACYQYALKMNPQSIYARKQLIALKVLKR